MCNNDPSYIDNNTHIHTYITEVSLGFNDEGGGGGEVESS